MPERPSSSKDLAANLNNITERLRAVERLLSMTSEQQDQLLLQTFEDGNPLGDTLSINFGSGLDAVLIGDRSVEVEGLGRIPTMILGQRADTDATQTLPNNTETEVQYVRAVVNGSSDWTWSSATASSRARLVYQGDATTIVALVGSVFLITDVGGGAQGLYHLRLYKNASVFLNAQLNTLPWASQQITLPWILPAVPGDEFYITIRQITGVQMLIDASFLRLVTLGAGFFSGVTIT